MADIIWGVAEWVHDGATFMLRVTHTRDNNRMSYGNIEKIRVKEVEADPCTRAARKRLVQAVFLQPVRCEVSGRDAEGRLAATVYLEHPDHPSVYQAAG